jgi:outer membrane protein TolC
MAAQITSVAALLCVTGCTARHHQRSADREAYQSIQDKAARVPNLGERFVVDETNRLAFDSLPQLQSVDEFLGKEAALDEGARVLSLEQALHIAVNHSRIYRTSKEQLYLAALEVTLARHRFRPLFTGRSSATYGGETERAVQVGVDEITGAPKVIVSDNLVERNRINGRNSFGADLLIADVGRLSAAFTSDFLRFMYGDQRVIASSQMTATLSRPLLRNAGFKAEQENLTQAERALLYAMRDFARFRKEFTVQVAAAYYSALSGRDAVRNAFNNLERFRRSVLRSRSLAGEGRVSQSDLGRLEQQVLAAEGQWIATVRNYRRALDDFKMLLGVPVETRLVLDERELAGLQIEHPEIQLEDCFRVALAARMDFQNVQDQLDDATRRVKLAADGLKPQLDAASNVGLSSRADEDKLLPLPDAERYRWSAGLNLDLPLDRKQQRNAYRTAQISEARARRTVSQREDEIRQQVRESWRSLEQGRRNYEIAQIAAKLAEKRRRSSQNWGALAHRIRWTRRTILTPRATSRPPRWSGTRRPACSSGAT